MEKTAIFPGSFDPFTIGHQSLVLRALNLFEKIVIGIGVNSRKQYLFTVEQRKTYIRETFKDLNDRISVVDFEGLTVNYCKENQIPFIVRGIRNHRDFQMEYEIGSMNKQLNDQIETILLASNPEYSAINSTIVREILRNGGNVSGFVPKGVELPTIQ